MKKTLLLAALASVLTTQAFAAEKLTVAATPVPHAEILELIKPKLAEQGVDPVSYTHLTLPTIYSV